MKISFSAGRIGFYVYLVSVTRREREKFFFFFELRMTMLTEKKRLEPGV